MTITRTMTRNKTTIKKKMKNQIIIIIITIMITTKGNGHSPALLQFSFLFTGVKHVT